MKFSELWLREWVNPAIDSEALSDQITMELAQRHPVTADVAAGDKPRRTAPLLLPAGQK
nr:hypothetical protein [Klebsiella pneumoniae]